MSKKNPYRYTGRMSSKSVLVAASKSQLADAIVVARRGKALSIFTAMPSHTRADIEAQIKQLQKAVEDMRWRRDVTFMRSGRLRPGPEGKAANVRAG